MNSEIYQEFIQSDRDMRRMLHSIKTRARAELLELIEPLPPAVQTQIIDAFVGEIVKGSDPCGGCRGKASRQPCGRCQDTGRQSKEFRIVELENRVDSLERYAQALADNALFSGEAAVAPI